MRRRLGIGIQGFEDHITSDGIGIPSAYQSGNSTGSLLGRCDATSIDQRCCAIAFVIGVFGEQRRLDRVGFEPGGSQPVGHAPAAPPGGQLRSDVAGRETRVVEKSEFFESLKYVLCGLGVVSIVAKKTRQLTMRSFTITEQLKRALLDPGGLFCADLVANLVHLSDVTVFER